MFFDIDFPSIRPGMIRPGKSIRFYQGLFGKSRGARDLRQFCAADQEQTSITLIVMRPRSLRTSRLRPLRREVALPARSQRNKL
jgi:hypothetical protein